MKIERLEVLVEEPSMEIAMRELLPKMVSDVWFHVYSHQCKAELFERLSSRLRGYREWLPDSDRILVLVDQDDDDCRVLKKLIDDRAAEQGLRPKSGAHGGGWQVASRIVIEELEAWYFGDWEAVVQAYPRVDVSVPSKAPFRDSDQIAGGTWERLETVLQRAGYFKGGLRKLELARTVAPLMDPGRNRSRSFQALRSLLERECRSGIQEPTDNRS